MASAESFIGNGILFFVIAVVADSHLGQSRGDETAFLAMLQRIRSGGAQAVYLLGDMFHFLIGDPKFASPELAVFLEGVRAARAAGVRVHYVEGNRDFYLRGSYLEREFDSVSTEATFRAGARKFLLLHGDGINRRDWPYRFWRFVSKNPVAHAAMKLVPARAANRFVAHMERRLRDSNFKHKSRLPEEMIREYASRRLPAGFDVLLLGHFHRSWRSPVDGGEVEIVPPFLEEKRWMEVDEAGRTSLVALS